MLSAASGRGGGGNVRMRCSCMHRHKYTAGLALSRESALGQHVCEAEANAMVAGWPRQRHACVQCAELCGIVFADQTASHCPLLLHAVCGWFVQSQTMKQDCARMSGKRLLS